MKLPVSVVTLVTIVCCGWIAWAVAADCGAIADAYSSALHEAQICNPAVSDSCAASRAGSLRDICRCQVAVNPQWTADLDRLATEFKSQSCPFDRGACNLMCLVSAHICAVGKGSAPTCR